MKFIQFVLAMIVIVLAAAKLKRNHRHHRREIIKSYNEICGAKDQKCNVGLKCCLDGGDNKSRCKYDC
jgi:hypothetical protein